MHSVADSADQLCLPNLPIQAENFQQNKFKGKKIIIWFSELKVCFIVNINGKKNQYVV